MHSAFKPSLLVCLALLVCASGCGARSKHPPLGKVRGKVTYQGKPVTGASVAFLAPGASRMAVGTTDANGEYQLSSYEPNDGAIVGKHVVTVKKVPEEMQELPQAPVDPKDMDKAIEASKFQTAMQLENLKRAKPLIPPKYADRNTTDLEREVVEGENVIDLELVD